MIFYLMVISKLYCLSPESFTAQKGVPLQVIPPRTFGLRLATLPEQHAREEELDVRRKKNHLSCWAPIIIISWSWSVLD